MKKEQILHHPKVQNWKEWEKGNMSRCYLSLKGYRGSWAGDRNTKVYWDNNSNTLEILRGKGLTSTGFEESLQALQAFQE